MLFSLDVQSHPGLRYSIKENSIIPQTPMADMGTNFQTSHPSYFILQFSDVL